MCRLAMRANRRVDTSDEVNRLGRHAVDLAEPAPKCGRERVRR